ncbi:hypothetical protein RUND412_000716 [Rhizina undulata]
MASRAIVKSLGSLSFTRSLSCSTMLAAKKVSMPPRPKVNEEEIEEAFLKGRYVAPELGLEDRKNKTNSAVQLKHLPTGIVIKSQATRSREQNRKIARRILAEKLEELDKGGESRAAKIRDKAKRKRASKFKKARRKYSKLNGETGLEFNEDEEDDDDEYEGKEEEDDDVVEEEPEKNEDGREPSETESQEHAGGEIDGGVELDLPSEKAPEQPKKKDRRQRKRFDE